MATRKSGAGSSIISGLYPDRPSRAGGGSSRGIVRRWRSMRRGSKEQRGMRSGCLNVALMLLVASVATALTVAGVVLFLSFDALTFE